MVIPAYTRELRDPAAVAPRDSRCVVRGARSGGFVQYLRNYPTVVPGMHVLAPFGWQQQGDLWRWSEKTPLPSDGKGGTPASLLRKAMLLGITLQCQPLGSTLRNLPMA